MKKLLFSTFIAASVLLTGCSDGDTVAVSGSTVTLNNVNITFPDDWSIMSGDELYDELASMSGVSADEFAAMKAEEGINYFAQATAPDNAAMAVISSQDISPADGEEQVTLADYARSVHDSMIFDYLASDFRTGSDSSFSAAEYGGQSGYLSHFEVFTKDDEPEFCLGFSEFLYEQNNIVYTIQICYFDQELKQVSQSVIESISTAQ